MIENVKPVGYIKLTKEYKTHINQILRRQLSAESDCQIPYILSARAVLLYDCGIDAAELKASLNLLAQDVEQRDIHKKSAAVVNEFACKNSSK